MSKKIKKQVILLMTVMFVVLTMFSMVGYNIAQASLKNKTIINDDFSSDELKEDNWFLVDEKNEAKVTYEREAGIAGTNGTFKITDSAWFAGAAYYNKNIVVAPEKDLIIEYDLLKGYEGTLYYSVAKGMQMAEDKVLYTVDDRADSVIHFSHVDFSTSGYAACVMAPNDQNLVTRSDKDTVFGKDATGGDKDYGLVFSNEGKANNAPGARNSGFRYKMIYDKDGGYSLYSKKINEDSTYAADWTLNQKTVAGKFIRRSGYVGFNLSTGGNSETIEIDNFAISVGDEKVVEDNFDNKDFLNNWAATEGSKTLKLNKNMPRAKLTLNNPSNTNYVYANSEKTIIYDGYYDNYCVVESFMSIKEITGNKTFGFVFGGTKSSQVKGSEGIYYLYFNQVEGAIKLNLSTTKNGTEILYENKLAVPYTIALNKEFAFKICARINKSVDVYLDDILVATFKDEKNPIILENRLGIISNSDNEQDSVVAEIRSIQLVNKFKYTTNNTKTVALNFNGVDKDGNSYLNDEDAFIMNKGADFASVDKEQGVYVKDGALKFVNGGHGSGLVINYDYSNWTMEFDITEMNRAPIMSADGETLIRPVSNAPIIIAFGMQAAGTGYTTGKAITITSPLMVAYGEKGYNTSVADVKQNTQITALQSVGGSKVKSQDARINFLDPKLDGYTLHFKLEAFDGNIRLSYCVMGYEDYQQAMNDYVLEFNDVDTEGYVAISTTHDGSGQMSGSFTIDNFKINDTDGLSTIKTENKPEIPNNNNNDKPAIKDKKLSALDIVLLVVSISFLGVSVFLIINNIKLKKKTQK